MPPTAAATGTSRSFLQVDVVPAGGGVPARMCDDCGLLWDWSSDGRWLLFADESQIPLLVGAIDTAGAGKAGFLKHRRFRLVQPHFSPDDKWVVVAAQDVRPGTTQIFVVRRPTETMPAEAEWIPITDGSTFADKPRWSPDGRMIYFTSDRDGFRCLWAQGLDATTKRPAGEPLPVFHFHTARRSLLNTGVFRLEIAVALDKIVFNLTEITGNIWLPTARSVGRSPREHVYQKDHDLKSPTELEPQPHIRTCNIGR